MRHRNGERNLHGGDRAILDRGYGLARRGDRWLPDRWLGIPGQIVTPPGGGGLADGDLVTTWPDSSGKGHDATASGAARPIFKTYVINGKPVVRFTSAAFSRLNLASTILSTGNWTIFAVMKPAVSGSGYVASLGTTTFFNPCGPMGNSIDGGVFSGSRAEYNVVNLANMGEWRTAFHVITVNPSTDQTYLDGTVKSTTPGANASTANFDVIGLNDLAATAGGPYYSDGDIAEIIAYNANLSSTDRANVEKYLGTKYGITVSSGGTAVDPSTVAGLLGWWKADSLWTPPALLADGDAVSMWPDVSGQGHHGNKVGNPIFKTNIVGGKPVVRLRSASSDGFNLATSISGAGPLTYFAVMKVAAAGGSLFTVESLTHGPWGIQMSAGNTYAADRTGFGVVFGQPVNDYSDAFHVLSAVMTNAGATGFFYADGTVVSFGATVYPTSGNLETIGYATTPSLKSDGDIAEIIVYSGQLALRAKLVVLLTVLITTGEFPSASELDAMVGNRHKIEKYLHKHGAHPTKAQLDAVVTPMAVNDRANIEKYLGTKYGITVAGGTAVDPSTVAGLLGWWKADSLG